MTAAYVDSSCLVAVLLGEPTGAEVARMLASYGRLFWPLPVPVSPRVSTGGLSPCRRLLVQEL